MKESVVTREAWLRVKEHEPFDITHSNDGMKEDNFETFLMNLWRSWHSRRWNHFLGMESLDTPKKPFQSHQQPVINFLVLWKDASESRCFDSSIECYFLLGKTSCLAWKCEGGSYWRKMCRSWSVEIYGSLTNNILQRCPRVLCNLSLLRFQGKR